MNNFITFGSSRGYSDVLLEEIALEGLDGITLELLWKRLEVNPEWKITPIDELVEEFIWKLLLSLDHIDWYELSEPRESPRVFSNSEQYLRATDLNEIDVFTYSSTFYPHNLINDINVLGSCSTYYERIKVTHEIHNTSLGDVKTRWGNKLVMVASQTVRNFVLVPPDENPDFELSDLSYCVLERIGRSRRCGEFTLALNFLKNGANPLFYFWNKLRRRKIIKTQAISIQNRKLGVNSCTLIHLSRFYRKLPSEVNNIVLQLIEKIESNPLKMCLFSEARELFAHTRQKLTKSEIFRRYIKIVFVPYNEYFLDAPESQLLTKNGNRRLVRVLQLVHENSNIAYKELLSNVASEDNVNANEIGILEGTFFLNKPYIAQCYHLVNKSGATGLTMVEIERKLGVSKLFGRLLVRNLQKCDLIVNLSSEDARKRVFRYYSKDHSDVVKSKVQEQVSKFAEFMDTTVTDDQNLSEESVVSDCDKKVQDVNHAVGDVNSEESPPTNVTRKRQPPTDIENPTESENSNVKKLKLDSSASQKSIQSQIDSVLSESTECSIPASESIFVMRRLNIVLKHVYKMGVTQRFSLARVIVDEEAKHGIVQGIPARNSLKKVVNILSQNGKIKIIKKTIRNEGLNRSRELEFLCTPTVTEDHPIIQSAVQEALNCISVVYIKNGSKPLKKPSLPPFVPRKKSTKYGYRAKFNRMKILHELLTYLIYQYEGGENLDVEECKSFVQPLLQNSESAEELPKFYKKEISWKMFIPPLMPFDEYGEGWISQTDLAERLPLKLFFSLIRLPYDHPDAEQYLQHPIKQYYLMRHLPSHLQEFISVDKRYVYSLCLNLRLLSYSGLIQFGPRNKNRGFQNLVYLNKKAQLMDTRLSPPSYAQIMPNINYPIIEYDFTHREDIDSFWNDAMRFSIGTKLGRKKFRADEPKKEPKRTNRIPQRLVIYSEPRTIEEAPLRDNGEIPGDKLGAAGFDSWMCSHLINQWFLNKSEKKSMEVTTGNNKVKPVKLSKISNAPKAPSKPVSKLMRFRRQIFRKRDRPRTQLPFDKIDVEALNKMRTLRAKWNKSEDEILLMCHIASKYYSKPISLHIYRPYLLFRKILHNLSEKSKDKTVHACKRRIVTLLRSTLKKHSVNLCLKEMAADIELQKKFQKICEEIEVHSDARDLTRTKTLLDQLTEEVFYHLHTSKKMSVLTRGTFEVSLPDDIEKFRENFNHEYAVLGESQKYLELTSKKDVAILSIINLIFSTLFSQVDKTKLLNVNFLYGIFKQFDESQLKSALHYIRMNRLISNNKSVQRNRSLLLPFGSGVYHLSLTYHIILKSLYRPDLFGIVYSKYLDILSNQDYENVDISNFDAGLALLLISFLVHDNIQFQISVPEMLLLFNEAPLIIDESNITKPSVQARTEFSDSTLSLIREKFFKCKNDEQPKEKIESDEAMELDESLIDDCEEEDEDDKLVDFSLSKISIYITRNQFKHTDIRFSNAYDHYLINPYSLRYSSNKRKISSFLNCENRKLFLENLEKAVSYKKIKFTSDELVQKIRKFFHDTRQWDYAVSVIDFLLMKGLLGASSQALKAEFVDVQLLRKVLNLMVRKKLIIRDGSTETHYVHISFAEHWLIRSCKNQKLFMSEYRTSDRSALVINRKSCDEFGLSENSELLWLAIRPWIHINGTINESALDSLLTRILAFIVKMPASSLMSVQKKFLPALQPHSTRELVEFLEQLKCIKSYVFVTKNKVTLFSKSMEYAIEEASGLEEEDMIILEPEADAFVTFSIFLSSTSIKDLLDTKYTADMGSTVNQPSEIKRKNVSENGC